MGWTPWPGSGVEGAPATTNISGGWAIGTVCIIDQNPREYTVQDQQELRALPEAAQNEIRG